MDNLINGKPFDMMNQRHRDIINILNKEAIALNKEKNLRNFCKENDLLKEYRVFADRHLELKKALKERPEDKILFTGLMKENKFDMIQKCTIIIKKKLELRELGF